MEETRAKFKRVRDDVSPRDLFMEDCIETFICFSSSYYFLIEGGL